MANSCIDGLSKCCAHISICLTIVACAIIIPCLIFGSISASSYVKNRNTQQLYTSTTCLLTNYSILKHQCHQCNNYGCSYYKCFDEYFTASYSISNNTYITSALASMNRDEPHLQTQIGNNYSCFYQPTNVMSFIWDLPNTLRNLIALCVTFGLAGLSLILLVIVFLHYKITK